MEAKKQVSGLMDPPLEWNLCDKDIISRVDNDVLLEVLCRMDTKSALATSILSRRWRKLPALLHHFHLILDTTPIHKGCHHRRLNQRLVSFLNHVIDFANAQDHPNMKSLVVEFDYFKHIHTNLLKQCIEVALSKNLEHLQVLNKSICYDFPVHHLTNGVGDSLQSLAISNCFLIKPLAFCIFSSLQKLALVRCSFHSDLERMSDGIEQGRFEMLLQSFSKLEILSLEHSTILPSLVITAPNQLKELTINYCKTDGIEIIHAPKLEKFACFVKCPYFGSERCKLSIDAVPCLKHVRLGFEYYPHRGKSGYTLDKLSKTVPHLETLILSFEHTNWINPRSCKVPFPNLRQLVLVEGETSEICDTFWIFLLLKSAPMLESLEIELSTENYWCSRDVPSDFVHENLKELKVKGYQGKWKEYEIKLISCLLKKTKLERVIINFDATTHATPWITAEKNKILLRLGGGVNSNPLITFA